MFEIIIVIMIACVIMGTRTNNTGMFAAWVSLGVTLCCAILIVTGVDVSTAGMATVGTTLSGVLGTHKLHSVLGVPVMGRDELFHSMVTRTTVLFADEYRGMVTEGIIQSIEMEDGSGYSFNMVVEDGGFMVGVYYNTRSGHTAIMVDAPATPEVRTVQYTNRGLFMRIMEDAQRMHHTMHDNGNTLVLRSRTHVETYNRMTLSITYRAAQ